MAINDAIKFGRLRWFGHVKRREEGHRVKRCMHMERAETLGNAQRPKRTWRQVVREDLKLIGMEEEERIETVGDLN